MKYVPLLLVSVVGLAFIDPENFATWNLSGQSTVSAIGAAMALCLFSYIGVESASVAAVRVRMIIAIPVYLNNRTRMTQPGGAPPA